MTFRSATVSARTTVKALAPVVLALTLAACAEAAWRGTQVDPPKDLPSFSFTHADGAVVQTVSDEGRPTFVFFGYTHCPDVCPTTLADWARVRRQLGSKRDRVRFLFVTIDPGRDRPDIVQRYVDTFDEAILGVSADSATTDAMQRAFGAVAFRESAGDSYTMAHSPQTFLLDARGRLVAIYSFGSGWDAMLHDVERLL